MDPRLFLVVAGIGGAAALQGRLGDGNAERRTYAFRYTPDADVLRVVAGAHRSSLADLMWLQTLPDIAREFHDRDHKKRWLESAFHVITELDPTFVRVYSEADTYLGFLLRRHDDAIAILEKGVARNPESSGLRVQLAMAYWMYRGDRTRTVEHLQAASRLPGADSLSLAMLSSLLVEGREDVLALAHWIELFAQGESREIRAKAEMELLRTKLRIAERAAREFAERHGAPPTRPEDLRDPAFLEPGVADLVLPDLTLGADGRPAYARLEVLEIEDVIRSAEFWCSLHMRDKGRWPTLAEVLDNPFIGRMPPAPAGKRWRIDEGQVSLEDE